MKLAFSVIFSFLFCSMTFANTLLTCKAATKDNFVKSVVLSQNGNAYSAKIESAREDGVVEVELKAPEVTATSTKYTLIEDHDLLVSLVVYGKKAVVLQESADDASVCADVEFLNCK